MVLVLTCFFLPTNFTLTFVRILDATQDSGRIFWSGY